jgi:hypothetical protein
MHRQLGRGHRAGLRLRSACQRPLTARAVYLEVTDLQTVRAAVEAAVKAFGRIKEVTGFGI